MKTTGRTKDINICRALCAACILCSALAVLQGSPLTARADAARLCVPTAGADDTVPIKIGDPIIIKDKKPKK